MITVMTAVVYALLEWMALLMLMYSLPHKPYYLLRAAGAFLLLCIGSWIDLQASAVVYAACVLIELAITTLTVRVCTGLKIATCCYCAIWAAIVTVGTNEVWTFLIWSPAIRQINLGIPELVSAVAFSLPVYVVIYWILARPLALEKNLKIGPRQLSSALLLWGVFVTQSYLLTDMIKNLSEVETHKLFPVMLVQLYCPVVLWVQNVMFRRSAHDKEMQTITRLYEQQCSQYQSARKNVEMIYRYSHELKMRLAAVQKYLPEDFPQREWQEAKDAVAAFDRYVKTGNDVLDIVLTEKMMDSRDKNVQINAVADGKALDFMEKADLYALFSGMLDGLIRYAERIPPEQNRLIDLIVFEKHKFVVVHAIMESCPNGGSVYTTTEYKMLKRVAESYEGLFSIEDSKGEICVRAVFPEKK